MPLRDDLLNPIPGPNPGGENLRYAPVYLQINEARRQEEEVSEGEWRTQGKKADWILVTKLCGEALAKKSKDLQLAAWLTEATLMREGFPGLRACLELIRGLLENFWDSLYPEIEDGDVEMRATPIEWVGSRLDHPIKCVKLTRSGLDWLKYKESRSVPTEAECAGNEAKTETRNNAIADQKITPEEFDAAVADTDKAFYETAMEELNGCLEALDALGQLGEEKFGEYAPNMTGLKKSLEEVKQTVHVLLSKKREQEPGEEAEEAAPEPAEAVSEEYAGGAAAAAAPARAKAKPAGPLAPEPADRDDAIARVLVSARWLRQNEPGGPAAYLIPRALRWGELRAGGSQVDPALLEAPSTETRQELKRLATDGSWQEVLEAAETAAGVPCGRAWLDLQRYAVRACEELGYPEAAAAIRSGVRALLADFPGLPDLSLTDDTPCANPETRTWIREQVNQAPQDVFAAPPKEPEPEQLGEETIDVYQMAVEAARGGNIQDAIEMLNREAAQERSGRGRFQRRTQLAQICLGAGYEAIAYPILDSLAAEIERRSLEEWEPAETLAHTLALLYRCMQKTEASEEDRQKTYHRLCRLDPVKALEISK